MDEETRDVEAPGIEATEGTDPTLITAAIFILLGFTPIALWRSIGVSHFGPLAIPALLAMVGILFAFITVLRGVDLGDVRRRNFGIALGALGLIRLFLFPLLA